MKQFITLLILSVSFLSLSSCNTMIGLGRDFKQVGEGLEKTGNRTGLKNNNQNTSAPAY